MFIAPFSFRGHIGCAEYTLTSLVAFAVNYAYLNLANATLPQGTRLMLLVCIFGFMWFYLAQGTKRCREMGVSPWWQIVPLYNIYMMIARPYTSN